MDVSTDTVGTDLLLPRPTLLTKPFWRAAHEHRLIVQCCEECGKLRFYPSEGCNSCSSSAYRWIEVSGHGRVYSWIVVHRTVDAAWQKRLPFISAIINLDEQPGVLMPGLLTGIASEDVRPDLPVEVWFEDLTPEISVPRWKPASPR